MENKWISVKDRLPAEEQDVLVLIREIEFYGKHKEKRNVWHWIHTGWYIDGEWATTYCFGHKYISEEENDMWELAVTHWMPLPELPKEIKMENCKATVCLGNENIKENICKNCIKADVCKVAEEFEKEPVDGMYIEGCEYFKDRTRFVELPCRVGDTVYEMILNRDKSFSHWNTHKVVGVHLGNFPDLRGHKRQEYLVTFCKMMNFLGRIPLNKLGKTVFLTREEAEKALNNPAKSDS